MTISLEEEFLNKGRLSAFVGALAVYPPKMEKDGFDLLDIVMIKPNAAPSKRLEATHVNLSNLDRDEATRLLDGSESSQDSSTTTSHNGDCRTEELPHHSKYTRDVRLCIKGESQESVRNTQAVEDILRANLRKLLLETRFRYHFADDAKRILLGVVVKAKHGALRLQRATKIDDDPVGKKTTTFEGPGDSVGSGVLGVHLLVFKVSMKSGRGEPTISRSGDVSYSSEALDSLEIEQPTLFVKDERGLKEGRKWATRSNFRTLFGLA